MLDKVNIKKFLFFLLIIVLFSFESYSADDFLCKYSFNTAPGPTHRSPCDLYFREAGKYSYTDYELICDYGERSVSDRSPELTIKENDCPSKIYYGLYKDELSSVAYIHFSLEQLDSGLFTGYTPEYFYGNNTTLIKPSSNNNNSQNKSGDYELNIVDQGSLKGCKAILSQSLEGQLGKYWSWIQIIAPVLLILFGMADFGMAVVTGDQDSLKKATSKFTKRAIATFLIFLIPLLVKLFFTLFFMYSEDKKAEDVKICFFEGKKVVE